MLMKKGILFLSDFSVSDFFEVVIIFHSFLQILIFCGYLITAQIQLGFDCKKEIRQDFAAAL